MEHNFRECWCGYDHGIIPMATEEASRRITMGESLSNAKYFRIYNGCAILGTIEVPASARDALKYAEHEADRRYDLWDRMEEV